MGSDPRVAREAAVDEALDVFYGATNGHLYATVDRGRMERACDAYVLKLLAQDDTRDAVAEQLTRRFGMLQLLSAYDEQSAEGWRHDAEDVLRVLAGFSQNRSET